jgi:acetyltransferase-like isoleucine patch superfamily enzyme
MGPNTVVGARSSIRSSSVAHDVQIGSDCRIDHSEIRAFVALAEHVLASRVTLGSYSYAAEYARMAFARIGSFCSIGPAVRLGFGRHPVAFASTNPVFYSKAAQCGVTFADRQLFEESIPPTIGNDVWLGANAFIGDGITIGDGAVVAAGAVVANDVPAYGIVGGVPARVIRMRFDERTIARLIAIAWWNWPEDRLRKAQALIATEDVRRFLDWAEGEYTPLGCAQPEPVYVDAPPKPDETNRQVTP